MWLLLLCCGAARANFHIRTIRPELSVEFSQRHEEQIWHCFCKLLNAPPDAVKPQRCPSHQEGLGLRSAWRLREVAHWASWADTMKMVKARHPDIADIILQPWRRVMRCPACKLSTRVLRVWLKSDSLHPLGKSWPGGWQGIRVSLGGVPFLGGIEANFVQCRSFSGPKDFPMSRFVRLEPQVLRVLFLRRLCLPLPLPACACRCGRPLDVLGHHRSACAVAGGSLWRTWLRESAERQVGGSEPTFT